MNEQPLAGWYPDPADAARSRWWNGQQWTGTTRRRAQGPGSAEVSGSDAQPAGAPDRASSAAASHPERSGTTSWASRGAVVAGDDLSSADVWDADWSSDPGPHASVAASSWTSDAGHDGSAEHTARIGSPPGANRTGLAYADWDDVHLVREDDPESVGGRPESHDEEERRRQLEYQRLQRLRASRAIRQDRIEELVVRPLVPLDERPWWRRAASFLTQMFVILAVITVWTTILGFLLSEDASGDVPAAQQPDTQGDGTGTEVLAGEAGEASPDEAVANEAAEGGDAAAELETDPAGGEAEGRRSFGALPLVPIDFDGQCALEIDPLDLEDLSVWPWQFDECQYAPVDLDGTEAVWIVVVSSMDGASAPSSTPTSQGGEELGLLWSSHYPSLNPGWWVVYAGPFESEGAATSARTNIGGGAYVRPLVLEDSER